MEIRTRYLGPIVCLDLLGRLVAMDEDDRLKDRVNSLLFENHRKLLLNLEDVLQVDTSGLSILVGVRHAVERSGGVIKLLNLPPRIHNLLVVTKLITLFDVVEAETNAARAFSEDVVP